MKKLLLLFILIPTIAFCQTQIGDDIDGEAAGDLSSRVSLSGDGTILAIGAFSNNGVNGIDSGHVRVYKNINETWMQIGNDIDGEATEDQSGYSISLSNNGNIVAIGAISNTGINGDYSGHVRVYENINNIWTQIGNDIDGEAEGDNSGWSVSLSDNGNIVAIGAFNANYGVSDLNSGHVRIYENINSTWIQIGNDLDAEDVFDHFGRSVSLSSDGNIVAIGSTSNDGINGNNSGHVRIYENINSTWTQIGSDIDGEAANDGSGRSVSLSSDGTIVAIGAAGNNGVNGSSSGHVRIYKNINSTWTQIGNDIDGEGVDDFSGFSVSLSNDGNIVAIGGPFNTGVNGSYSGHVRIYKNINNTWIQIGSDIDGEAIDDSLGFKVSLSSNGNIVAIGANGNDDNGDNSGHVRVYSIASELAILEVVEDITGNSNGINVTAAQLNAIEGVSGAIDGVNYTTALDNGTFVDENNPTTSEIQAIIDLVNASLSVIDSNILNFSLFPNPTKTQFTIQLNTITELKNVNIYNNLGQLVLTSKERVINTSKLNSGLYVVELETNKGKGSKKLIINK